jgi:hypothetical protein
VRRFAAASLTVAVFAAVVAVRVAFAPIRWGLASLTEGRPAEEDGGYVWWRDDEDRDLHPFDPAPVGWQWPTPVRWLPVAVDPAVEVGHNGKH